MVRTMEAKRIKGGVFRQHRAGGCTTRSYGRLCPSSLSWPFRTPQTGRASRNEGFLWRFALTNPLPMTCVSRQ